MSCCCRRPEIPSASHCFLWIAPLLEEAFVLVSHRRHHPAPLSMKTLPGLTVGVMRGSHSQSLIQPLTGVTRELVTEEVSNASKLARGRIQAWAVAWNTARYNQQRAGLPLPDLVRGETLQQSTLYWPPAPLLPQRGAALAPGHSEMREDGSLARILHQYDYQAP
jgi:polar amino acid transport system substrate-binding protein